MAHLVILGGGFGGLAAAHHLRQHLGDEHEITLVARDDHFYMGFAKLWDLAGLRALDEGTRPLSVLEDRGVRFRHAEITRIDGAARRVETSTGTLQADGLIVAVGAIPSPQHRTLLDAPGCHDLYDGAAIPSIRDDLEAVTTGRVVVAVLGGPHKCPPAPYEAALIVDQILRRRGVRDDVEVTVTTPKAATLPVAGPDASAYVAEHLGQHGVDLRPEHVVDRIDGGSRTVAFADGTDLDFDVLLGVPANVAPPVVASSDLVGASGWIEPDRGTLGCGERVYAVGDCTMIPTATGQLPMAGVFAAATAEVAAANLAADLGVGDGATYDGHGYCFLELPDERVAYVEGNFYADPPDVRLTPADREQFRRKQAYERERLDLWLGSPAAAAGGH